MSTHSMSRWEKQKAAARVRRSRSRIIGAVVYEMLEERRLMSLSYSVDGSVWTINGTGSSQTIDITLNGGNIRFSDGGTPVDVPVGDSAFLDCGGGADTVNINTNLNGTFTSINGSAGNDTINGGAGNERFVGGSGTDCLFGGDGDDYLWGADGAGSGDLLDGGNGTDCAFYDSTTGVTVSLDNAANDGISLEFDNVKTEDVVGSAFNDTITGSGSANGINGMDGNDSIDGGSGNDTLNGVNDDDTVIGGPGNDSIFGGDGNDSLAGGSGADSLYGNFGTDTLNGTDSAYLDVLTDSSSGTTFLIDQMGLNSDTKVFV